MLFTTGQENPADHCQNTPPETACIRDSYTSPSGPRIFVFWDRFGPEGHFSQLIAGATCSIRHVVTRDDNQAQDKGASKARIFRDRAKTGARQGLA